MPLVELSRILWRALNLSPFLNHWPLKISNDSLVLVDGLVDRRFLFPEILERRKDAAAPLSPSRFLG